MLDYDLVFLLNFFLCMQTWNSNAQACPNSKIIAARLTSMRNIYLREELRNIAKQIQEQFQERLPVLPLVSLAAYEQVFQRQVLERIERTDLIVIFSGNHSRDRFLKKFDEMQSNMDLITINFIWTNS